MKNIIIIGGGLAGLSAGVHAQKYGFTSTIYEQHTITGGQCTGWNRQGFHIDNCIDWLTGTKENTLMNDLWCEIGALGKDVKLVRPECHNVFEYDGQMIHYYNDFDKLKAELLRVGPEDKERIEELMKDVEMSAAMDVPVDRPIDMYSLPALLKLGMKMKDIGTIQKKYADISCKEYAAKFKSPLLQKSLADFMPEYYSAYTLIFTLATVLSGNGDIPVGGSLAMVNRIQEKYESLGGKVVTGAMVEEIIVKDNKACGIRLQDGSTVNADYVIAACDVKYTFDTLLKGQYHDSAFDSRFAMPDKNPLPTSAHVTFAVDMDLKDYPTSFIFETEKYTIAESECNIMGIRNYAYEPSFAPAGKSVINIHISQWDKDYLWWEKLYEDKEAYKAYKEKMAQEIQKRIEKRFPEWVGKLTLLDTYTPMTYKRYCNSYHGSWMSFVMVPGAKQMMHNGKIKELGNCFLAGMWLQPPGGTPVAAVTGKYAVQRICKLEKIKL